MHPNSLLACLSLLALAVSAAPARAADAHRGVQAQPGEIVLLRDVHARPAYRPAPPGMALIVDPSPRRELAQTLGTGELSDADFAALSSGQQLDAAAATDGPAVTRLTAQALQGTLGAGGGAHGAGTSVLGTSVGGAVGTVGQATRGIGAQVTGALSQLPFGATANPGKGP